MGLCRNSINNLVSVDRRCCDFVDFSVTNYMLSFV